MTRLWSELNRGREPSQDIIDNLAALGLTVREVRGLSPEMVFRKLVDGMKNAEDKGRALASAMTLMKDRSGELMTLLQDLSVNGLPEFSKASVEAVRAAELINDTWAEVSNWFVSIFAPVLLFVTDLFSLFGDTWRRVSGHLLADALLLQDAFLRLGRVIKAALSLDFSEARRQMKGFKSDLDVYTKTIAQVHEDQDKRLAGYYARTRDLVMKFSMKALASMEEESTPEEAASGKVSKVSPTMLAGSLQRIGGGGSSVQAMQRDEALQVQESQLTELKNIKRALSNLDERNLSEGM
jgi:hypothetical protein